MKRKVIVTCAVTGNAPFNPKHPCFPVTPKEIAESAVEAAKAGASIAHLHVREPESGAGSRDPALFREVVDRVRDSGVDIVINLTGGLGAFLMPDPEDESKALPESDVIGVDERMEHLEDCLPEIASLDVTTGNQVEGPVEFVYLNTTRTLTAMARRYQAAGIKPELEAFQAGDVLFANHLVKEGLVDGTPLYQFVLGILWGAPADPETVLYMRNLLPKGVQWTAMGIGRNQMKMAALSVACGGNVRVGLEDNLYLDRGVFATNGQLVERARTIIETQGEAVATPAETREILGLRTPGRG
ncbi:MAG: 3-keto-5-aminohexanoate cleavage protein [Lysobacterales bacterium]|jgi:uncharacterized protein (DUF849 family)